MSLDRGAREKALGPSPAALGVCAYGRRPICGRTSSRCRRRMISGLGSNADQRLLGSRSSDRREDKPVAWMPPRSAHLPLQNPKLMPQGDNLSVKLRLLPIANTQQVDQKTGNGVHQACKHGPGMIPDRRTPQLEIPKSS